MSVAILFLSMIINSFFLCIIFFSGENTKGLSIPAQMNQFYNIKSIGTSLCLNAGKLNIMESYY